MKALLSLLVLIGLAAGGYLMFGSDDANAQPADGIQATQDDGNVPVATAMEGENVEVAKAEEEAKEQKEVPRKFRLYFPDGTWLPALNGATNPKPVRFRDRPYSPVIDKRYDPKFKRHWYVHADGSWSTTVRMDFRGQKNTVTQVMHPGGKPHVLLDEEPDGSRRAISPYKKKKGSNKGANKKRAGANAGSSATKPK